jgi:hypothetical protein
VCSTMLISSVDTLIKLMSVSSASQALEQSLSINDAVLVYYMTLVCS